MHVFISQCQKNVHVKSVITAPCGPPLRTTEEQKKQRIILVGGQAFLIDVFCVLLLTVTPPPPPGCISQPYLTSERTQCLHCVTLSLTSPS